MILSVDGDTKRGTINKFVDNEFLTYSIVFLENTLKVSHLMLT